MSLAAFMRTVRLGFKSLIAGTLATMSCGALVGIIY